MSRAGDFATSRRGGLDHNMVQAKLDEGYPLSAVEAMYGRVSDPSLFRRKQRASYSPPAPPPRPPIVFAGEPLETPRDARLAVIGDVAALHGFSVKDLLSRNRLPEVVVARHEAMWEVKNRGPDMSLPALATLFCLRNHTSVLNGLRRHEASRQGKAYCKRKGGVLV